MEIFGYELLFRDGDADQAEHRGHAVQVGRPGRLHSFGTRPVGADGRPRQQRRQHHEDEATAQVIVNTFMEIGLYEMVGNRRACINVSPKFVLSDFCEALPPERVVLELVGPLELDADVMKRLQQLAASHYDIAVGDYALSAKFRPLLDLAAIIKFDMLGGNWSDIERRAAHLDRSRIKLAAERVENVEQVRFCRDVGFDYFQGYFFCRPEFVRAPRLPLSRLITLRLIGKLHDPDVTLDESARSNLTKSVADGDTFP